MSARRAGRTEAGRNQQGLRRTIRGRRWGYKKPPSSAVRPPGRQRGVTAIRSSKGLSAKVRLHGGASHQKHRARRSAHLACSAVLFPGGNGGTPFQEATRIGHQRVPHRNGLGQHQISARQHMRDRQSEACRMGLHRAGRQTCRAGQTSSADRPASRLAYSQHRAGLWQRPQVVNSTGQPHSETVGDLRGLNRPRGRRAGPAAAGMYHVEVAD